MSITITVTNKGAFVAHCRMSWIQDDFQQQATSEHSMTAGTNWSFTLPEGDIKNLQLWVEHDTGLVWKPRNATGTIIWKNPAQEIKNGEARVEIFGTTLINYGVEWKNP